MTICRGKYFIFFGIFLTFLSDQTAKCADIVSAYYPDWNRYEFPADSIAFNNLTHIVHAFVWPAASGELDSYSRIDYPELIQATHRHGKKILISVGGWGNCENFSGVLADTARRTVLVQNLISFCEARGYDGVDLDWEYPESNADRKNLTEFVRRLYREFQFTEGDKIITMAVPAGAWAGSYYDYIALAPYIEWFGCMTYDFHGFWTDHAGHNAPLYAPENEAEGSADDAIRYLLSRGVPANKILLGIPFYGRRFYTTGLYQASTGGSALMYRDVVLKLSSGWDRFWDTTSCVPYLLNPERDQLITYDDTVAVRIKCDYVQKMGLRGVKIWHIGQDHIDGGQPLLATIAAQIFATNAANEHAVAGEIPKSFRLRAVYPNPFNSSLRISIELDKNMDIYVDLYNIAGQKVDEIFRGNPGPGINRLTFLPKSLPAGVYLISVTADADQIIRKVVYLK